MARTMPDQVTYPVACSGCYSNLLLVVKRPSTSTERFIDEERRQLQLDGWSYINGQYAICPDCSPAWSSNLAS